MIFLAHPLNLRISSESTNDFDKALHILVCAFKKKRIDILIDISYPLTIRSSAELDMVRAIDKRGAEIAVKDSLFALVEPDSDFHIIVLRLPGLLATGILGVC